MSTKWAENCSPELPARDFARSVLAERVEGVESRLPQAAHHYQEDVEHVHQLRVACRRAAAALRAFEPLISKKPRKLKKWLSRIRDAAGPARDIDVLIGRFAKETTDAVTEYAVARLTEERHAVQQELVKIAKRASGGKFDRASEDALQDLDKRDNQTTLGEFGMVAVKLAYLPFARLAHIQDPTTDELHQLRIAGKRLRYSLEIFHGLFPGELREEVYPLVEDLQGRLGELNDHATAQALYQKWLAPMPADELAAQLADRVVKEHKKAERLKDKFLTWWSAERLTKVESFFQRHCLDSE